MRQIQGLVSSARELSAEEAAYPGCPDALPPHGLTSRAYAARFARNVEELRALQRLRFDVFNLELGEGLAASFASGLDRDEYDIGCHHLIVTPGDQPDTIVGTYRMQTSAMARQHAGFYSSSEFDLSDLPPAILDNAVELGRACIAAPHRHTQVLMLLWRAIAHYLTHNGKHYLFGCCSVSTQDPSVGWRLYHQLCQQGVVDTRYRVSPRAEYAMPLAPVPAEAISISDTSHDGEATPQDDAIAMPPLMRLYLRYGGRVFGTPAIDRRFGTIDFLVLFDVATLSEDRFRTFFGAA